MTVRSTDFGTPVRPYKEYAPGVLRGDRGEPVIAAVVVAAYNGVGTICNADADDRIRDDQGRAIGGISFYAAGDRTSDGRVIGEVAYYDGETGAPL